MEISPILLQESLPGLELLLTLITVLGATHLALLSIRVRIRLPHLPRPSLHGSILGGLGIALALGGPAAAYEQRHRARVVRIDNHTGAPPWSEPSGPPPPLPLGSTTRNHEIASTHPHPAIHPGGWLGKPLFPRVGRTGSSGRRARERANDRAERARAMERHPSGKGIPVPAPRVETKYTVVPGDTLWDIAAKTLDTHDLRRIARYWPRLHRANRETIGRDPNLLRPGQSLRLPPETGS
jgi:hypothetical protein